MKVEWVRFSIINYQEAAHKLTNIHCYYPICGSIRYATSTTNSFRRYHSVHRTCAENLPVKVDSSKLTCVRIGQVVDFIWLKLNGSCCIQNQPGRSQNTVHLPQIFIKKKQNSGADWIFVEMDELDPTKPIYSKYRVTRTRVAHRQ